MWLEVFSKNLEYPYEFFNHFIFHGISINLVNKEDLRSPISQQTRKEEVNSTIEIIKQIELGTSIDLTSLILKLNFIFLADKFVFFLRFPLKRIKLFF